MASGTCDGCSLHLSLSFGSSTTVHQLNSSANYGTVRGSGLAIQWHIRPVISFLTLTTNSPANCLFVGSVISPDPISYVLMRNNSCTSGTDYPGMLHTASSVAVAHSRFEGNEFDYFVGGGSVKIEFANCSFDFMTIRATKNVTVSTNGCAFASRPTTTIARPSESRNITRTAQASEPVPPKQRMIAGIVIAAISLLVFGSAGVYFWLILPKQMEKLTTVAHVGPTTPLVKPDDSD
jgi:hypothetical protein